MTYSIHIITGHDETIADFATNRGLDEFRQGVESGDYPKLQELLDEGACEGAGVHEELTKLLESSNKNVQSSIKVFMEAIDSVTDEIEAMVLSNGEANDSQVTESLSPSQRSILESWKGYP